MTLSTTTNKDTGTGDGATTTFPFTFAIQQSSDMDVYVNGVLQGSGYSVSINPNGVGGNVVFSSAPADGAALIFARVVDYTQTVNLPIEANIPEQVLENMADKNMMAIQQIKEITDRCFKLDITAVGIDPELDSDIEDLAGYILAINATEDGFEFKSPSVIANEVTEANGDVTGPASATDGNLVGFDGATGKAIKDLGVTFPTVVAADKYKSIRVNSAGDGLTPFDGSLTELTVASNTIAPTKNAHEVGAGTVNTITPAGIADGDSVTFFAASGATVVFADAADNIITMDGADVTLDDALKSVTFVRDGDNFRECARNTGASGYTRVESSQKTVAVNTTITHAHGFGAVPTRWGMYLLCISTDLGYAVNDKVNLWWEGDGVYDGVCGQNVDATNIEHRFGAYTLPYLLNASRAFNAITAAKWKAILWAEIDN